MIFPKHSHMISVFDSTVAFAVDFMFGIFTCRWYGYICLFWYLKGLNFSSKFDWMMFHLQWSFGFEVIWAGSGFKRKDFFQQTPILRVYWFVWYFLLFLHSSVWSQRGWKNRFNINSNLISFRFGQNFSTFSNANFFTGSGRVFDFFIFRFKSRISLQFL